jgi:protein-L-isoaspartate(D-aspartate) O-methyltransferase
MLDFQKLRQTMVDTQVRPSDVTDRALIAAMLAVPRQDFVPAALAAQAYLDSAVAVDGAGARRLLRPMVLAKLLQAAQISPGDRVLDVGCATGYTSAVLARLANSVVGLDEPALAAAARSVLAALGVANVAVVQGPLAEGWQAHAPYDVIVVDGAMTAEPTRLFDQLADGGRLVGILGGPPVGRAMLYCRDRGEVAGRPIFDASAPVLPGLARLPEFVF